MTLIQPVNNKTEREIILEWDRIAELRKSQITDGEDISLSYILLPCILDLARTADYEKVVDVGCGSGFVSYEFAKQTQYFVGVDFSAKNIEFARQRLQNSGNAVFYQGSIEQYANAMQNEDFFTLAVASMTLMDTLSLETMIDAVAKILMPSGCFVFTITHPWFWSFYRGYANEKWFKYKDDIVIEAPFDISNGNKNSLVTTHVHRPLERYINALLKSGFSIIDIVEPMPTPEIEKLYPQSWQFPRFLGMKCIYN